MLDEGERAIAKRAGFANDRKAERGAYRGARANK
jgi:hypothetical protein